MNILGPPLLAAESTRNRLSDAITDGEILRIRYSGGSQPGTIRDIRPVRMHDTYVEAFDETSHRPKSFKFALIEIVSLDLAVDYHPHRQNSRRQIDISTATAGWAFYVPLPLFAPALGIIGSRRVRMNLHSMQRQTLHVWTQADEPDYDFQPGYIFHDSETAATAAWGSVASHKWLQIADRDATEVSVSLMRFEFGQAVGRAEQFTVYQEKFARALQDGIQELYSC